MRILLCVGEGMGNCVQVLPLVNALRFNNIDVDIYNLSNCSNETISWIFKEYAEVVEKYEKDLYDGRIELATTKGILRNSERLETPLLNNIQKQFIYSPYTNEVEVYLSIATDMGLSLPKDLFNVKFPEVDESEVFDFVVHNGCTLLNTSYWHRRKYPKMGELIETLEDKGYTVANIGAPEEYSGGTNKTGLTIQESASLIKNAKFFISNDTGTFHIAAVLKQAGLVLFTATSSVKSYHPTLHKTIKIVTAGLDCQPCLYRESWDKCNESSYNNWACRNIPIETIIKEIKNADIF